MISIGKIEFNSLEFKSLRESFKAKSYTNVTTQKIRAI
jgi:hypothetical protein